MKPDFLFDGALVLHVSQADNTKWNVSEVSGFDHPYIIVDGCEWNYTLEDFGDHVRPVPITFEILTDQLGARPELERFQSTHSLFYFGEILVVFIGGKLATIWANGKPLVSVAFAHEIQRACHALTGQPLKRMGGGL